LHIIETTARVPTKVCTMTKTTKCSSWVVQPGVKQIHDGGRRRAAILKQEAQLPQRDRATCTVSKFMLCFTRYWS